MRINNTFGKTNHDECYLMIATSAKNPNYRGLYCPRHQQWLMWINPEQERELRSLGITDDPSPKDLYS